MRLGQSWVSTESPDCGYRQRLTVASAVKFFKPTTRGILRSLWDSMTGGPEPDPANLMGAEEGEATSQEIVSDLKSKAKDETQWRNRLQQLQDQGYQPELVFLDVGLVTELSDSNRKNFLDLFSAIAHFDGYKAGQLMVECVLSAIAVRPRCTDEPHLYAHPDGVEVQILWSTRRRSR